jgi:hypothetical protein
LTPALCSAFNNVNSACESTLLDDAFQIARRQVLGEIEDGSRRARQPDAIGSLVNVLGRHDRASMMNRPARDPQSAPGPGHVDIERRASSVPPHPSGAAAADHQGRIGCTQFRAAGQEGVGPDRVAIHAFPDQQQLAAAASWLGVTPNERSRRRDTTP